MITDRLIEGIIKMQNPTCVGLDTLFDYLPDEMKEGVTTFEGVAEKVLAFNKKIIDVNMAQLESKYVGETGKNIEAAFATAREQDALLFFDEADAVLGASFIRSDPVCGFQCEYGTGCYAEAAGGSFRNCGFCDKFCP